MLLYHFDSSIVMLDSEPGADSFCRMLELYPSVFCRWTIILRYIGAFESYVAFGFLV